MGTEMEKDWADEQALEVMGVLKWSLHTFTGWEGTIARALREAHKAGLGVGQVQGFRVGEREALARGGVPLFGTNPPNPSRIRDMA